MLLYLLRERGEEMWVETARTGQECTIELLATVVTRTPSHTFLQTVSGIPSNQTLYGLTVVAVVCKSIIFSTSE
jgi:hypothetical protein